ncbi:hypothetical protein FOPG_19214 [Fusarium oxysporum f. sp. conglutinans race 2 54008]|uniref:Heterokaryon incompatibility domain-containing protein n=1 Tax=Fusarium oxysporum f. sp. conglutinans race 2 54008 TaxID=1089457 RepID=X0GMK6_FUSOX|nr:hypothetical protein FOPG_19214 [Fusarium oxysporum f. sp. conglutinans race 2 54008]
MDSSDNSLQYLKSVFRIKRDIGPEDEYHLYPFAPDGHPASEFVDALPLNLRPGSTESLAWIREFSGKCQSGHLQCKKVIQENRQKSAIPKRPLDVGQFGDTTLQLFATSRDAQKSYAIASYAWGVGPQAKAIQQARTTQGSLLFSEKDLNCALDTNPVDMRIWTFQEHLISTRVISFGSRQTRWKCKEFANTIDGGDYAVSCNDLEHSLHVAFSPSQYPDENLVEKDWRVQAWLEIIEQYSSRQYSRPEDRLPAFYESITRLALFIEWGMSECVEGIWMPDASRQLLWKKETPLGAQELSQCPKYGPSWSWATLPGAVTYDTSAWLRDLGDSVKAIFFEKSSEEPA